MYTTLLLEYLRLNVDNPSIYTLKIPFRTDLDSYYDINYERVSFIAVRPITVLEHDIINARLNRKTAFISPLDELRSNVKKYKKKIKYS